MCFENAVCYTKEIFRPLAKTRRERKNKTLSLLSALQ